MSCEMQDRIEELENENRELKKGFRYLWLTMGFYQTRYNYSEESACPFPDGSRMVNVLRDGGCDALRACEVVRRLGFSGNQIRSWDGPWVKDPEGVDKTS